MTDRDAIDPRVPAGVDDHVARWIAELRADPSRCPAGVTPIAERLVRRVGRGPLRDGRVAFVKWMTFPRPKDRLRYVHRPLPAEHEARMLRGVAAAVPSVVAPEVLAVVAERRRGRPHLSVLVTAGLPVDPERSPDVLAAARVATELARHGFVHTDLHLDNVLCLRDGRLGVVDLQSARRSDGAVTRADRIRMAVKLLATLPAGMPCDVEAVVAAGLVDASDRGAVQRRIGREQRRDLRRRVRRCLTTSTEFVVRRDVRGTWFVRRAAGAALGAERPVGRAGRELWIGDRAREILSGARPLLAALFRAAPWLPGEDRVCLAPGVEPQELERARPALRAAFRAWRGLRADA
ncbi:MAG: hypothetical protein IPM29_20995 [Planctomycetes bacterium]|nr:hypothetical protein [Planctomycetota bacterium]